MKSFSTAHHQDKLAEFRSADKSEDNLLDDSGFGSTLIQPLSMIFTGLTALRLQVILFMNLLVS